MCVKTGVKLQDKTGVQRCHSSVWPGSDKWAIQIGLFVGRGGVDDSGVGADVVLPVYKVSEEEGNGGQYGENAVEDEFTGC